MLKLVRKVIKGSKALYFTLPAAWIRAYNVQPGTLLDVELQGKSLKIRVASHQAAVETVTDATAEGIG